MVPQFPGSPESQGKKSCGTLGNEKVLMNDTTHHIGLLLIDLFIPSAQSLKEKRMVVKSLKDRVRSKYNVSIAQLDTEDKWQTATLGISMIGNDQRYMEGCLQDIFNFIEGSHGCEICDHKIEFL